MAVTTSETDASVRPDCETAGPPDCETADSGDETMSNGFSRRNFLRWGGLGVLGLTASETALPTAAARPSEPAPRSCLFIHLHGGPSALETFDPKPQAPAEVRGPSRAISTAVPGLFFSDCLPGLAQRADRLTVLRSLYHQSAPLHETSQQLLFTGRLKTGLHAPPTVGSIVSAHRGDAGSSSFASLITSQASRGGIDRGLGAGALGDQFAPVQLKSLLPGENPATDSQRLVQAWRDAESPADRNSYGETEFGRTCLLARQLIEQGVQFVQVQMCPQLDNRISWDCHCSSPVSPAGVDDCHRLLGPELDRVLSALLDDLQQRDLFSQTLVVVAGEFGRTPKINRFGGRDHWARCWSALLAGGGAGRGEVIGSSDSRAAMPADRPVHSQQLVATVLDHFRIDATQTYDLNGKPVAYSDARGLQSAFVC